MAYESNLLSIIALGTKLNYIKSMFTQKLDHNVETFKNSSVVTHKKISLQIPLWQHVNAADYDVCLTMHK